MLNAIRSYLQEHESEMFDLLERIININSHSPNRDGVNAVADILEETIKGMGFTTRRIANNVTGDNLIAENAQRQANGGGPLLVGHMDTVFPKEMGFNTYRRDGDMIYGPGVSDMKAGLVIAIYAAKALMAAGMDMPMAFFFNADEEIGSPHSRDLIMDEARKSDFSFVFEASGTGGEVVTGRKGRRVFDLTVNGMASHAGHCAFPKPSAIVEMAHKITRLEALNAPEEGTSLNVGLIEGGVGPNTIAARCVARVETRHLSIAIRERVWAEIQKIAEESTIEGTSSTIEVLTSRPPMVTDDTILGLYKVVEAAGKEVGIETRQSFRGGGSDANIIAQLGIPVVDGMGPAGAKIHTSNEYMHADCMVKQSLLTAVSMVRGCERY